MKNNSIPPEIEDLLSKKAEELCEKIYESLPDGLHKHADGKLYWHKTWCDPRTNVCVKHITECVEHMTEEPF